MTVYVDEAIWHWQGLRWCHLLADTEQELHGFAARLGVHRLVYQGPPKTTAPHYDLTAFERRKAIALGAKVSTRQEIVAVVRRVRVARPAAQALPQAARNSATMAPISPPVSQPRSGAST
ncbi:DUF4031 domain-containing protein [Phreatobacter sp.]|uniref:DUF4031 domain-containing protein n=1 Tax=Phreatobacter sp. TaxID=1966341 RepID=UPI003F72BF3C